MASKDIALSIKEVDRVGIVLAVVERRMKQSEAAERLGLSARQVRRLAARYERDGPGGLASRRPGRSPGNTIAEGTRAVIMARVRARYADFPPTLAREKLVEQDGYRLSKETLRKWMMAEGLWRAKARHEPRVHQTRERRARVGELVPIDGSPHDWFEGRAAKCSLIGFVDDATSRLLAARFWEAETTEAYMRTLREYLDRHGRPVALYSDRHSIFRVNRPDYEGDLTQFSRALETLQIQPIHAHSPQAKGRIERAFSTLQERLTRELRLRGIDGMEAANAWLPEYQADYNQRFGKAPREAGDAHRETGLKASELDWILCPHHVRKLTKNLTFKFRNGEYGIQGEGRGYRLRGAQVTVCESYDGQLRVLREGRELEARLLAAEPPAVPLDDDKSVNRTVEEALRKQRGGRPIKPAQDHPWNAMACAAARMAEVRQSQAGR